MADILPKPSGWKILIKKKKPNEKSKGGIYLPDQAKEAESYMDICAHRWAEPGDWVIVPKFTQFKMEIEEEEYRFINDDEIIAIVPDPTAIKVYS